MNDIENSILSKSRILLVDNNDQVRHSMASYFRDITQMFVTAGSAEEALPLLEGPLWDIVVCNLKLPGINGLEFCKRAGQLRPGTKFVLATHHSNPSLFKKAADCGVIETINAPLTPDNLIVSLINVFSIMEAEEVPITKVVETGFEVPESVSIMELDESMIITSFVRFSAKYQLLGPETCVWIQHNFKGAEAVVHREDKEIELSVEEIEPGDSIKKLHRFPIGLMNLIFVRKKLINELKKRGFLAFEVKRKPTELTLSQKIRLGAIRRTEEFIGKVSENVEVRDLVSNTIRDLFSVNDGDYIDTFDLLKHVNSIVDSKAAEAISVIATLKKGDHNYTHSLDVGAIFFTVYTRWLETSGSSSCFNNDAEILLSAILHDIGIISLPREISESRVAFDRNGPEMKLMREHAVNGARILSRLDLSEVAVNMAHYHHVKMDITLASSYPVVESYDVVMQETRLLAIVDMFQALIGQRPYKKSWHPSDAMKYIDQLAGIECDTDLWNAFCDAIGLYPVGSLVELSDGAQAFVVDRVSHAMHRPSVVVTRNSYNEELTHNTLIDLNIEKDISIRKGLDHFQIYGDKAINRFLQLQIS